MLAAWNEAVLGSERTGVRRLFLCCVCVCVWRVRACEEGGEDGKFAYSWCLICTRLG